MKKERKEKEANQLPAFLAAKAAAVHVSVSSITRQQQQQWWRLITLRVGANANAIHVEQSAGRLEAKQRTVARLVTTKVLCKISLFRSLSFWLLCTLSFANKRLQCCRRRDQQPQMVRTNGRTIRCDVKSMRVPSSSQNRMMIRRHASSSLVSQGVQAASTVVASSVTVWMALENRFSHFLSLCECGKWRLYPQQPQSE